MIIGLSYLISRLKNPWRGRRKTQKIDRVGGDIVGLKVTAARNSASARCKGGIMKKVLVIVLMAVLAVSSTALGWSVFNDGADNYCAGCHDRNVVHAAHSAESCLSCHVAPSGDVPVTSSCAVCHGAGEIVNFHNGAGITSCAICHAELPNERCSWSELKSGFLK